MPLKLPSTRLSTVALAVAGGYAAAVTLLYFRQHQLLYRAPKANKALAMPEVVVPAEEGQPALRGWVDNPGQADAMLYLGGSSEAVELRRQSMAEAFPNHTRYLIPYRGFGPNQGLRIDEAGLKQDALRSFKHIASHHDAVDVLGRSLGTGIALFLAARAPVRRLGLITPYDSILAVAQQKYRWLPVAAMLRDRFEAWHDAGLINVPILACLAEKDDVTTPARWESLRKHFKTSVEVLVAPRTNHTTIAECPTMWDAFGSFFKPAPGLVAEPADAILVGGLHPSP